MARVRGRSAGQAGDPALAGGGGGAAGRAGRSRRLRPPSLSGVDAAGPGRRHRRRGPVPAIPGRPSAPGQGHGAAAPFIVRGLLRGPRAAAVLARGPARAGRTRPPDRAPWWGRRPGRPGRCRAGQSSKASRSSAGAVGLPGGWPPPAAQNLRQGQPLLPGGEEGADGAQGEAGALEPEDGPQPVEVLLAVEPGASVEGRDGGGGRGSGRPGRCGWWSRPGGPAGPPSGGPGLLRPLVPSPSLFDGHT